MCTSSWGGLVDVVTRIPVGGSGVRVTLAKKEFFLCQESRPAVGPLILLFNGYRRFSQVLKRQGREVNYLSVSNAVSTACLQDTDTNNFAFTFVYVCVRL